jgi:hypothetical protein
MSHDFRDAEDQKKYLEWCERMKRRKERARIRKRAVITAEDGVAILAVYARQKQPPQQEGSPNVCSPR